MQSCTGFLIKPTRPTGRYNKQGKTMLNEKHDQKMTKHNSETPSTFCKRHGLKVSDLVAHTQASYQTLNNWHNYKPELFFTVVMGVKYIKGLDK